MKNKLNKIINYGYRYKDMNDKFINKSKNKIAMLSLLFLTFTFIFTSSLSNKSYAIEKPMYIDWLRELYDYDESITDQDIIDRKIKEDETGRVFFKDPKKLKYDTYDGYRGLISTTKGFMIGEGSFDFGDIDISCKQGNCNITYYNQADYGSAMYGSSTIREAACGPTALAMVIDSLTNANMGVVKMAEWAQQSGYHQEGGGSYWSLIPDGARKFGLNVNSIKRYDMNSVISALERNNPVIMICSAGDFTSNGHFITLVGIDEKGMVTVNDPGSRARSAKKWPITTIMRNASVKHGPSAETFWEIYR